MRNDPQARVFVPLIVLVGADSIRAIGYHQDPGAGEGDWDCFKPREAGLRGAGLSYLGGTDEEGEAASRGNQIRGGGEDGVEMLDGAQRHQVEGESAEVFGAGV